MSKQDAHARLSELTERQREVLKLFCDGLDDQAIAERLCIEESTVRAHMHAIRKSLRADDNVGLERKYCSLLRGEKLSPAPPDKTDQSEPELKLEMQENERLFLKEPEPPRPKRFQWLLVGVIFGMCLAVALTVGVLYAFRGVLGIGAMPQVTQAPVVEDREVTVVVTSTPAPTQPTSTSEAEVVPTGAATAVATATPEDTATPVPPSPTPEPTDTPVPPTPMPIPTDTPIPTRTIPPNTTPGSVLEVGERWKQDDVEFEIEEVYLGASSECLALNFDLHNNTDHSIVVTVKLEDFVVEDNLGRQWQPIGIFQNYICYQLPVTDENRSVSRTVDPGDNFGTMRISFAGYVTDVAVDEVIVTVSLSQIGNARWGIPIHN